ncbi:hypothetical protein Q7P37_007947 [Cladosporium fusiforme]
MANEERRGPRRLAPKLPPTNSSNSSSYTPEALSHPSQVQRQDPAAPKPKRAQVRAACTTCQRGKAKCDGVRPSCSRCAKRGAICQYDVEPDTSRSISIRRKNETLQSENDQLRSLLDYIRTRSEVESMEIYRRVRAAVDPLDVVELLRGGDLLLQNSVPETSGESETPASGLGNLDINAMENSAIKVRARPWTKVAGDGLVSELISSFFAYDNGFYLSFVDQESFLEDMQTGDTETSEFCSPLLVHAICALRCSTSERARIFGSIQGFDTRERFLHEARRLLDIDYGRRSLSTVQALLILYTCYTGQGRDRGGLQYRHAAYEMLKRLQVKLEAKFQTPGIPDEAGRNRYQKAISRALWGIYCFESISASAYLQPSLVRAPTIPRRFVENGNIDPAVTGHRASEPEPQLSAYVLNATCDLSERLYEAMADYSGNGLDFRVRLYHGLRQWGSDMPSLIRADTNFCPETSLLSMYEDMVALSLFRPLDANQRLPDELGTPGLLCLHHCKRTLEISERCLEAWPSDEYSIMNLYPLYHVAITLLHMLQDEQSHDLFERVCALLAQYADDFPLSQYILLALKTIAVRLRLPLPQNVVASFRNLKLSSSELNDVPAAFVFPAHAEMWDVIFEEGQAPGDASTQMGVEMGELLSQWTDLEVSS